MHFDFVDIGTSDFETSLDIRTEDQTVLLVEPLFQYLRNLRDGPGIFKANFAISNTTGWDDMFYVSSGDILKHHLPDWVRGCNSLGSQHPTVVKVLESMGLPLSLVRQQPVRVISFSDLVLLYDIDSIGVLKIDTEGHDHIILDSFLACEDLKVDTIICEYTAALGNVEEMDERINMLQVLGWEISHTYGDNMVLNYAN